MTRVAALGLDAAEPWIIDRLVASGDMPNLAALFARGARASLENTTAYRAEVPWTQFATGVEPADSRYWTMVVFDPSTYGIWERGAYDYLDQPPFWDELGGKKALVFDVPQVRVSNTFNGSIVTGWGAHSAQYPRAARPPGLLREIDAKFGPHPCFEQDNEPCWFDPEYLTAMAAALATGARTRAEILAWLRERDPDWDLVLSVMSEPHSIEHHCMHGIDASHALRGAMRTTDLAGQLVIDVFRAIDDAIGRFVDGLPADAVAVVFGLHGMRQNAGDLSAFMFAELLHRLTFGEELMAGPNARLWKARRMPLVEPEGRWSNHLRHRFRDPARRGLARRIPWELLEARHRLRRRTQAQSRHTFPAFPIPPETDRTPEQLLVDPHTAADWQIACWYRRYWPQMRAFVLPGYSDAHIRLNLEGREKFGRVATSDYERACDEVEATLRACVNPRTGKPVVGEVLRPRADDPFAVDGPTADLVVVAASEAFDAVTHPDAGLVGPYPVYRTGEHSPNGFFVAAGAGIQPGTDLGVRSALDVTPTILSLLGVNPPERYRGAPLLAPATA